MLSMRAWRQAARVKRLIRIAALAVLFASVAPSVSAWLASASDRAWLEICSPTGIQRVAVDRDAPADPSHDPLSSHCAFCRLQQDLPAIAQAPGVVVLADGTVVGVPPPPWVSPLFVARSWPAHRSHGPPSLS